MENGTVTIGIDFYTALVENNAIMNDRLARLQKLLDRERTMVYVRDVANIFGIEIEKEVIE